MDKPASWKWKDFEALAQKLGATAREIAEMVQDRTPRSPCLGALHKLVPEIFRTQSAIKIRLYNLTV